MNPSVTDKRKRAGIPRTHFQPVQHRIPDREIEKFADGTGGEGCRDGPVTDKAEFITTLPLNRDPVAEPHIIAGNAKRPARIQRILRFSDRSSRRVLKQQGPVYAIVNTSTATPLRKRMDIVPDKMKAHHLFPHAQFHERLPVPVNCCPGGSRDIDKKVSSGRSVRIRIDIGYAHGDGLAPIHEQSNFRPALRRNAVGLPVIPIRELDCCQIDVRCIGRP